jgi:hypothetical protein
MLKLVHRLRRLSPAFAAVAAVAAGLVGARPAEAVQIFTDRAAWEAALAGAAITTDPFDSAIAPAATITFESGVISAGVPDPAGNNSVASSGAYQGGVGGTDQNFAYESITWTFPVTIIGFGMDLFSGASASGLTLTADFDGTGDQTISVFDILGAPGTGFLGIIGDVPISTLFFTDEDLPSSQPFEIYEIDNLSFAAATTVPEPATLALLGAGLAGLAWVARRRKAS